jgi:hypothetical protein
MCRLIGRGARCGCRWFCTAVDIVLKFVLLAFVFRAISFVTLETLDEFASIWGYYPHWLYLTYQIFLVCALLSTGLWIYGGVSPASQFSCLSRRRAPAAAAT